MDNPVFPRFIHNFLGKSGYAYIPYSFIIVFFDAARRRLTKFRVFALWINFYKFGRWKKLSTILADVAEMDGDERTCVLEKGVGVTVELFGLSLDEQVPYAEDIAV